MSSLSRSSSSLVGILCMLASTVAFVLNDSFIKLASAAVPTFQLLFMRAFVACLVGAVMITAVSQWRAVPSVVRPLTVLRGGAETAATFFFTLALVQMPIANLFAIGQTIPLFLILGATMFFRERLGKLQLALISVGFMGALLVARPDFANISPSIILAFGSSIMIASRDLIGRKISSDVPAIVVSVATSVLVMLAAGTLHFSGEDWAILDGRNLIYVVSAGLLIALGQAGVVLAYRFANTATIAPLFYSFSVWSVLSGYFIFNETPGPMALFGILLIVASGLALVHLSQRNRALQMSDRKPEMNQT